VVGSNSPIIGVIMKRIIVIKKRDQTPYFNSISLPIENVHYLDDEINNVVETWDGMFEEETCHSAFSQEQEDPRPPTINLGNLRSAHFASQDVCIKDTILRYIFGIKKMLPQTEQEAYIERVNNRRRGDTVYRTLVRSLFGTQVTLQNQIRAEQLVESCNEVEDIEIDEEDPTSYPTTPRTRMAFTSLVVSLCKTQLPGITVDNKANRLVAHRFIYNAMVEKGLRPSHIHRMLPIAIEMVFVPDSYELDAREIANSHAVLDALEARDRVVHSRGVSWALNWFGRYRTNPASGSL
jgi:hypothetical protein